MRISDWSSDVCSSDLFGASCLQAELDRPQAESNGAVAPGHADCSQVFNPLLRPVATAAPGYVVVAVTVPHELPFRQLTTSLDPPPPRRGGPLRSCARARRPSQTILRQFSDAGWSATPSVACVVPGRFRQFLMEVR